MLKRSDNDLVDDAKARCCRNRLQFLLPVASPHVDNNQKDIGGDVSTTVVFFESESGQSPVQGFLDALPKKHRLKCYVYVDYLRSHDPAGGPLPSNYAKHVRGRIYELRPEWQGTEYRLLYARVSPTRVVLLHALKKKTSALRTGDIELAEARLKTWTERGDDENSG